MTWQIRCHPSAVSKYNFVYQRRVISTSSLMLQPLCLCGKSLFFHKESQIDSSAILVNNSHSSGRPDISLQSSTVLHFPMSLSKALSYHCKPIWRSLIGIWIVVQPCTYSCMTFTKSIDPVPLNSIWFRGLLVAHFICILFTVLSHPNRKD